jgi:hypothetical protein
VAIPWDDVAAMLDDLDGVRRQGRRWTVDGRLVAREHDPTTLLVRSDFDAREHLVDEHPATFSIPPDLEAHMKVLVDLERGDATALRTALDQAVALQRR